MVQLPRLDWLLFHTVPVRHEESIFEIYSRRSNLIIAEKIIIIVDFDHEWWASGELTLEVETLVPERVLLIKLPVVTIILNVFANKDFDERIGWTSDITLSEVMPGDHIDPDDARLWYQQLSLEDGHRFEIRQLLCDL